MYPRIDSRAITFSDGRIGRSFARHRGCPRGEICSRRNRMVAVHRQLGILRGYRVTADLQGRADLQFAFLLSSRWHCALLSCESLRKPLFPQA